MSPSDCVAFGPTFPARPKLSFVALAAGVAGPVHHRSAGLLVFEPAANDDRCPWELFVIDDRHVELGRRAGRNLTCEGRQVLAFYDRRNALRFQEAAQKLGGCPV